MSTILSPSRETATEERVRLSLGSALALVQLGQGQSHWGTAPFEPEPRTMILITLNGRPVSKKLAGYMGLPFSLSVSINLWSGVDGARLRAG